MGGLVASKKSFQNIPEAVPNRIGINVIGERAAMTSLEYYDEWKPKNIQLVRKNQDRIRQELSPLGVKFFGPDAVHRIVLTLDEKIDPTEFNKKMASEGVQLLDISTRSYDVGVKHTNDPPFTNSLQATAAISDEWLDRFIPFRS